jgi:hypothetical protein
MDYALGQWPTLEVFLKDIRIDRQQPGRKRHPPDRHRQEKLAVHRRC